MLAAPCRAQQADQAGQASEGAGTGSVYVEVEPADDEPTQADDAADGQDDSADSTGSATATDASGSADDAAADADAAPQRPAPPVVSPPSQLPAWSEQYPELLNPRDGSGDDESSGDLLDRKTIPVTETVDGEPEDSGPALPVAGSMLNNRRCTISMDAASGWVLVTFLPADDLPDEMPRWALPNNMLAAMISAVAARPEAIFHASGENTNYDGRPFILLRQVTIESTHVPPALADDDDDADDDDAAADTDETTSDDVLEVLYEDSPGEPVLPPSAEPYEDRDQSESVAPDDEDAQVYHPGRGNMVVDRIIIVMATGEGKWMEAAFESDNTGNEPPLRLLPSSMLAEAERLTAAKPMEAVRFHVSGEITEYKSRRYLLIRKLIEYRDMGR